MSSKTSSTNNESIKEESSGSRVLWTDGEVGMNERPTTYCDFLKAQRQISFRNREKQVSFPENDDGESSDDKEAKPSSSSDESPQPPASAQAKKDLRKSMQMMRALSVRGQPKDSAAWESMVHELDVKLKKLDADGHFKDTGSLKIPWYTPPIQRHRWGDDHTLPIVNHGTLFFDLFFVGAVYNLGEMIISGVAADDQEDVSADTARLMLYVLGIFGPVFSTWENGVYYQSRYLVADYSHQVFELLRFLSVAAIVLFIRPIQELRDPQGFASVFMLVLVFFCESLMQLALDLEVYYRAQGDRETIQNHTLTDMKNGIIPACITYFLSTIIAAVFYFGPFDEPLNNGALWNVTDLPLTLTAAEYVLSVALKIVGTFHRPKGDIHKTLVPYNIDFVIQRYSDWFLLLLGEVVMAMVETTDSERNYVVALMGSLMLIVMFTLKFESEPDNPHGHALWRNTRNSYAFRVLTEIMSIGMIALSVTFKILLTEGRFGISEFQGTLALTISLAWVLISLELTLITHKGLKRTWKRLFRPNEDNAKVTIYWPLAWITLLKVVLFVFLFGFPVWQDHANSAIIFAFFVVLLLAISRIVGWAFVFKEDEIKAMMGNAKKKIKSKSRSDSSSKRGSVDVLDRLSSADEDTMSLASIGSFKRPQSADTYHGMFDAVIFADFEGIIVSVNNVAVKMFRYESKGHLVGQNISILVGGRHAEHHADYMKKFRDQGATSAHFGKQRKLKARRSNGEEFDCFLGIQLAGNGKHIIGFIRDLTDFGEEFDLLLPDVETKTEKQLKRVLDDNSFDSIAAIDLDGNIMGVNSTFVKEFRYDSKEEVLGLDITIIMDSHYQNIHTKMLARYRETIGKGGTPMNCKVVGKQNLLPVQRKDGTEFKCIIGVNAIEDSELLVGYIKNVESLLP